MQFSCQLNVANCFANRILWIALFLVGLLFAVIFSWNLWQNWQESPVLITIQTANYPVKPFYECEEQNMFLPLL